MGLPHAGRSLQHRPKRLNEPMRFNINKGWVLPMPETLYLLTLVKSSPAYNWGVSAVGATDSPSHSMIQNTWRMNSPLQMQAA